jgi:hypothetical protein
MTPEQFLKKIKEACGDNLLSFVVYGSEAAGDRIPGKSDCNVMLVLKAAPLTALKNVAAASKSWVKEGNPPPLIFPHGQLVSSGDVFPIELLDMQEFHKVLLGEDPLAALQIDPRDLRLALEHEFKGKLVHLRESYLLAGGDKEALAGLMMDSLSQFLVLCRAALRFYVEKVPGSKLECLGELWKYAEFDADIFQTVYEMRRAGPQAGADMEKLFARYLAAVEQLCAAMDKMKIDEKQYWPETFSP